MRIRLASPIFVATISLVFLCTAVATTSRVANAEDVKWACMKDKKEIKVEGKDPKEKKKSCEDQGGKWKKVEGEKKQSSGGGGGW